MKTQRFTSAIGQFITVTSIAIFCLGSRQQPQPGPGDTDISRCEPVNAQLDGSVVPCAESPVGFCAIGTVTAGVLKGSKEATYHGFSLSAGMPDVELASAFSYSGTQVFHTEKGDLLMSVVGVQDNTRQVFTEIARITGGTGRFSTATGNLFISGTLSADGSAFQSKVTGEIYFQRTE
jgi:hypothetical protein